jgi:glycogen debranching enzyme
MEQGSRAKLETPDDLIPYILPGEHIANIEYFTTSPPVRAPSGLRELYRLARAKVENKLYEFNPPLASLALESDTSDTPELHLYEALFGRDSLRVAMDLISLFPKLTRSTLLTLASFQGTTTNAACEEESGRIPHEIRDDKDLVAQRLTAEYGWQWPYYGSVDATPEFVRTFATYYNRTSKTDAGFLYQEVTNKDGSHYTMADAFDAAVDWMIQRTDSNPEGLLESLSAIPHGIENQVWKDSWDAYFHQDGTLANHEKGVASIEVQRIAYDAFLDAAHFYEEIMPQPDKAQKVRAKAEQLRQTIFEHFWTPEHGGYFVLGTDRDDAGNLRQLKVRASNMGHMLHSRLLVGDDPDIVAYREAVVRQLFSPELLTPSGIRTLASDEVRFRPGAYHNGSVWLWDTHFIAKGLRRHSYNHLADTLSERLFKVIDVTHAFPEFVRGDGLSIPSLNNRIVDVWDSNNQRMNRIEQPPQQVQAWSVAAILAIKHYNRDRAKRPKTAPKPFEQSILQQIINR